MKQLMGDILVSAFVGMVMPGILLNTLAAVRADPQASLQTEPTVAAIPVQDVPEDPQEQHISRDQALRNAVLLFRFFSAGGGGGGTPSEELPRKFPIWMMIKYHI